MPIWVDGRSGGNWGSAGAASTGGSNHKELEEDCTPDPQGLESGVRADGGESGEGAMRAPTVGPGVGAGMALASWDRFFFFFRFLALLGLCCCKGLSLAAGSGGYSPVAMRRLLIAVASLVEHWLQSTDSVIVAHGLGCSAACGIFLDQGSNPCLQHWQVDSLTLSHQGSP